MPLTALEWVLCVATSVNVAALVRMRKRYMQALVAGALNLMFLAVAAHDIRLLAAPAVVIIILALISRRSDRPPATLKS